MKIKHRKHNKYPDAIVIRDFGCKTDVNDNIRSWEYLIENNKINKSVK